MAKLFASGDGGPGCGSGIADSRWVRFHQGLPSREILPGCKALHHWRRYERDSAAGNCAPTPKRVGCEIWFQTGLVRTDLAEDTRALARAATLIETQTEAGRNLISSLFSRDRPCNSHRHHGAARAPGKARLVDRSHSSASSARKKVSAVIAVDPSSPYSVMAPSSETGSG